jgi:CDK-activating kinase assembly factor MAT1
VCPVVGCNKTLRLAGFRFPTFHDIRVEREIDIRKMIGEIFNRREEEFESLRAWNDYLNEVEDITFNLINGIDVDATKKKLNSYAETNQRSITENRRIARQERADQSQRMQLDEAMARQAREQADKEDEQERRERDMVRMRIIEGLAGGGDAASVVQENQKALIKRPGQKASARGGISSNQAGSLFDPAEGGFMIAGLRKRVNAEPEADYDPFEGQRTTHQWVTMPDQCDGWDEWLGPVRTETRYTAGGYDLREFYSRALIETFSGLGVFVGEEMGRRDTKRRKKQGTADAAADATVSMGESLPVMVKTEST